MKPIGRMNGDVVVGGRARYSEHAAASGPKSRSQTSVSHKTNTFKADKTLLLLKSSGNIKMSSESKSMAFHRTAASRKTCSTTY